VKANTRYEKANTNGIETRYEVHGGAGSWLVLSHSLACSARMWDPQIAEFSKRFRVLAYDTRGHGGSDAPEGPYSLEQLADDLHALLAHLGIREAHYAGLSMGGMIGQTFALKYPGVFRTLTLADTTSSYPQDAMPVWNDRIRLVRAQGMAPLVEPTLARWFTEAFRNSRPEVIQRIGTLIRNTPVAGYIGCSEAIPKINLTARLKEIRAPILVIVGDQDPGTPPAMAKEIHANAPGSTYAEIAPAAHLANLEQPEQFNRALDGFLKASA
jgi:3-oxoadipate enol-lactonase